MFNVILDCLFLYTTDVLVIFLLVGFAWVLGLVARYLRVSWIVGVTERALYAFVVAQVGVVLFALLGFKFVVLSGARGSRRREFFRR